MKNEVNEFRTCLNCNYQRGFHISFQKENNALRLIFICPECGASYDLDFLEDRLDKIQVKRMKDYPTGTE